MLICLVPEVKLNKDNQMSLLQSVTELAQDAKIKKKAYKLMAGVVKRFQFETMSELTEMH